MTVEALDVLAVVHDHCRAVLRRGAREDDRACGRRLHRRAAVGADVHAGMELGLVRPRRLAVAEFGVHRATHGPARGQRGEGLARAPHQPVERAKVLALLHDRVSQTIQLVAGGDAGGRPIRRGRRAAHAAIATAAAGLGTERLLDAGVHLTPRAHFLAKVGHAAVEVVDRPALLGDLRGEGR